MRKKQRICHSGDTRIIKKFFLFPERIKISRDYFEWVWLEIVTIKQEYCDYYEGSGWEDIEYDELIIEADVRDAMKGE